MKVKLDTVIEDNTHAMVCQLNNSRGIIGYIAIHRFKPAIPSFGATRYWAYQTQQQALEDVLRLSRLMSYKSALAGLPYGGAKGTIINNNYSASEKHTIIRDYCARVNALKGTFITGADVGINKSDMELMEKSSPYIVGNKVDPVKFTVAGLMYAIQVALKHVFGKDNINGRKFFVQGLGKTGYGLVRQLYGQEAELYVSDIDLKKVRLAKKEFPRIHIVGPRAIFNQAVDVFSPCALSNSINENTVNKLKVKIVAGSANNQLVSKDMGERMMRRGILYAPDYVANAGGLISVVDEYENRIVNEERIYKKVAIIKKTLTDIINRSLRSHKPTNIVADEMASEIIAR